MSLDAIQAPSLRWLLLAGALVGVGALLAVTEPHPEMHRLRLHAIAEPDAVYLSAFRNGDIAVSFDADAMSTITIEIKARVSDGCMWLGTETLAPIDPTMFVYSYDETILSCAPGATPSRKTPRTGIVTVDD